MLDPSSHMLQADCSSPAGQQIGREIVGSPSSPGSLARKRFLVPHLLLTAGRRSTATGHPTELKILILASVRMPTGQWAVVQP